MKKFLPIFVIAVLILGVIGSCLYTIRDHRILVHDAHASEAMSSDSWFTLYFSTVANRIEEIVRGMGGDEENKFEGLDRVSFSYPGPNLSEDNLKNHVFINDNAYIKDIPFQKFIKDGFFTEKSEVIFTLGNKIEGARSNLSDPMIIVTNFNEAGCIKINKFLSFNYVQNLGNGGIPTLNSEPNLTSNTVSVPENEIIVLPTKTSFGCYQAPSGKLYYISTLVKMRR